MNVDNIKDLFCLFMNHLTSLPWELARLAIYQPRELNQRAEHMKVVGMLVVSLRGVNFGF